MRRRRSPEIIAGKVNANGTIAMGDEFTVVKGTTGLYTLYFPANFRLISVVGSSGAGSNALFVNGGVSENSIAIAMYTANTAVLVDVMFHFQAVGVQQ